jgi:hypothetical protein
MGMPNPDYDDDDQRTVSVPLQRLEKEVEDLGLLIGEELVSVDQDGESVQFTVEQTGTE